MFLSSIKPIFYEPDPPVLKPNITMEFRSGFKYSDITDTAERDT